jgi:hypothetical protein
MAVQRDDLPVLEIRISRASDTTYSVELRLGEREFPRGTMTRAILQDESVADRGARLFTHFTADEPVRMAWNLAAALHPRRRIRLRLDDLAPELHTLPWEALTDTSPTATARTLAADRDTPFSRHVVTAWEPPGPLTTGKIRLLSAVAAPSDLETYKLPPLDRDIEAACIATAVATATGRVQHTHLAGPCTLAALEAELEKGYHVLHLVAHGGLKRGGGDGVATFFESPDGRTDRVDASRFAAMIERLSPALRLVVLMSCHSATRSRTDVRSGLAPQLLAAGVPAVLAMQDLVPIDTAHAFTGTFYRELWASGEVDRASNRARATILTARLSGDAIPVLYSARSSNHLWLAETDDDAKPAPATTPQAQVVAKPPASPVAPPASPRVAPAAPAPSPAPARERWQPFGGPYLDVQLTRQHDGRGTAFAVDADHVVHTRSQSAAGGPWGEWEQLCTHTRLLRSVVDNRGRVCLFALDDHDQAWCCLQKTPSGAWGPWVPLGGQWTDLAIGVYDDNSLTLFAIDSDHALHQLEQLKPDGAWGEWEPWDEHVEALAVTRDGEGDVHLFAVAEQTIYHTYENEDLPDEWAEVYEFSGEARHIDVRASHDGRTHLFAITPDGALRHRSRPVGGKWQAWRSLGGDHVDLASIDVDGVARVYTIGTDGAVWRIKATDKGWGDWTSLHGAGFTRVFVARGLGTSVIVLTLDGDGMLHRLE